MFLRDFSGAEKGKFESKINKIGQVLKNPLKPLWSTCSRMRNMLLYII